MSINSELIRSLVRDALRDVVASQPGLLKPSNTGGSAIQAALVEPVSISSDADLSRFVQRILDLSQDAATREQLRTGRIAFTLATAGAAPSAATAVQSANAMIIEKGAVTEAMVRKAAEFGSAIHLGPRAVLTALAKDKARDMGVEVIKTLNNSKGTVSR